MVTQGSYINLPSPGNKQAPKTFKGNHREVERFIAHFEYLCTQNSITDDKEKCLGLVQYCSYDVADLIEGLEEYTAHTYTALIKKFQHLYDSGRRKGEYHIGHIEEFTRAWRGEEIRTLETFLQYHREFLQVAGVLKTTGRIDAKEFNRGFWEGLNRETRDRIERRMMDDEPALNLTVPFDTNKVVKAAEHIFNRNRFDKHLREGKSTRYDSERIKGKKGHSHRVGADEELTEKETDEEDEGIPRWRKSRTPERTDKGKGAATMLPTEKKRDEKDDINDLVTKLEGLTIDQPLYRTTYVQLCLHAPKISDLYPRPAMPKIRSYTAMETREPPNERARRDLPPHQFQPPPDRRFQDRRFEERREMTCFGCGNQGHTMNQCAKLEALIDEGHIRRVIGKLRWADGSNIIKEPEESWASAVVRRLEQREKVPRTMDEEGTRKGVYLIEIARDESDASSDEQEGLGWRSGTRKEGHLQAYGAERTMRVSKGAKQGAERQNLPPKTHRVKEFPGRGSLDHPRRKDFGAVPKNVDFHRGQNRFEEVLVPVPHDVSPAEFKGEHDDELVPMEVEEVVLGDRTNNRRKVLPRDTERTLGDVGQTGPRRGKAQLGVVNGILNLPLTLSLQEIASISPSVRRDLAVTLRAIRDDQPEGLGTAGLDETRGEEALKRKPKEVFLGNLERVGGREARGDLLRVLITIGDATMVGVIDSGSMINMISARKLEESGLPSVVLNEKSFKITGVNGGTSRCKSWIPGATILVSKDLRETYGDVYVLEDADFEFIAGRPWSTLNGSRIEERGRGTYISWITDDTRYEINVSKASESAIRAAESQVHLSQKEETEDDPQPVSALVVRITSENNANQSCVPDSQGSRDELDYGGSDEVEEGNQQAQKEVEQWRTGGEEEDQDKREGGEEEMTPLVSLGKGKAQQRERSVELTPSRPSKKLRLSRRPNQRIIVDQDFDEGFSRLVQSGADDKEWELFCGKEKRRLARAEQRWIDWMDGENEDYGLPLEGSEEPSLEEEHNTVSESEESQAGPRNSPREESQTLQTPPPSVANPAKARPNKGKKLLSTKVVARRSSRVKTETTCSTCGGVPKDQSRAYQKRERAVRTIYRKSIAPEPSPPIKKEEEELKIRSFSVRVLPDSAGEEHGLDVDKLELGDSKTVERKEKENFTLTPKKKCETKKKRKASGPSPPRKMLQEPRVTRPFLQKGRDKHLSKTRKDEKEDDWAAAPPLTPSQAIERWRKLIPATQQAPGDPNDTEGGGDDLSTRRVPSRDKTNHEFPKDLYTEECRGEKRMLLPKTKEVGELRKGHESYLTWDNGDCTLHVPHKRVTKEGRADQGTIRVPPEYLPIECRTSRPQKTPGSGPSVRNVQIPSLHPEDRRGNDMAPDKTLVRTLRHMPGDYDLPKNIQGVGETRRVTDGGVSAIEKERSKTGMDAHLPSHEYKGPSRCWGWSKERSDEGTKEKENIRRVKSYTTRGARGEDLKLIKRKEEERRRPNLPNWRPKPPHRTRQSRLTSKTRTSLLLLLSLPLISLLLACSPPTTTMSYSGMNRNHSQTSQHYSNESDLPGLPERTERPPPSSFGDPSVPATQLDKWFPDRAQPSGGGTKKEDLGITGEPWVDRKNHGIRIPDEPTEERLSTTTSLNILGKSDRVSSESTRSIDQGQGRTGEVGGNQERKEVSVRPRIDLDFFRRQTATRGLDFRGDKLERKKDVGRKEPLFFPDKAGDDMREDESETREGRQQRPNSPVNGVKIGPPKFRPSGRRSVFEDSATVEARARTRDAAKGRSEIRIVYQARDHSPHPSWKGLPGLSALVPSRPPGLLNVSPSDAALVEQPTEVIPTSAQVLPQILEVLKKLRVTLGEALDTETRLMIHEVEVDAKGLLKLRGERKDEKDQDGDVTMGKEKATHPEKPSKTFYQPISPEPGQISEERYIPRSPAQEDEILRRIMKVEEEAENLQWKMVNAEDHNGRIAMLEGQMKTAEGQRLEEGWTIVRPPTRRQREGAVTRSQSQRMESAKSRDVTQLQSRVTKVEKAMEKVAKGGDNNRRRMNGLEERVTRVEEGTKASKETVEGWEVKEEEGRLRQAQATQEETQARNLAIDEISGHMARVEARLLELGYRTTTSEVQLRWDDQKIRCLWNTINSSNLGEAGIRSESLRQVWAFASEHYNRRQAAIPYAVPPPTPNASGSSSTIATLPPLLTRRKPPTF